MPLRYFMKLVRKTSDKKHKYLANIRRYTSRYPRLIPYVIKQLLSEKAILVFPARGKIKIANYNDIHIRSEKSQKEVKKKSSENLYISQEEALRNINQDNFSELSVKLIAFYLPQFHPIPENDQWWGKGFTEWRNVTKAKPNFEGHYQPRLPADLGFYDLRIPEIMESQAKLARRFGIYGFCYHYYWFSGKRLLEMPLERMLQTNSPDFPFCLSWANENWTRRWDGQEDKILIKQEYRESDYLAVILDIIRYFKHPNYIRINGKPLFLIYNISAFPNILSTIHCWRNVCRKEGIGEIYLAMIESFKHSIDRKNPNIYGLDATVEFPPHGSYSPIATPCKNLNQEYNGQVYDYRKTTKQHLEMDIPNYTRFRGVMPGWDNTARRQNNSSIFYHAKPKIYESWLNAIVKQTHERPCKDERLVFINAWNEWAEGAYLEPDRKFGFAYLKATKSALKLDSKFQVLLVTHDLRPHGAQYNALSMLQCLVEKLGIHVHLASLGEGILLENFEKFTSVYRLWEEKEPIAAASQLASKLYKKGVKSAIIYLNKKDLELLT
ncbi:MAG: glycoside hydrolase family 99-like domain-containing protein [Nitrosopumilaceae archaeon]|nr:glycoside hydrolase family 99-like domain-containing protein [Nitrosopumilaceae archaeon]